MGISYKKKYEKQLEIYNELFMKYQKLKYKLEKEDKINSLLIEKLYKIGGKKDEIT